MSKVALIRCENYKDVYDAIKKGIDLIGGIERFVNREDNILLKPNFLRAKEEKYAVTTNSNVFYVVGKILRENGYEHISYGDSPGTGSPLNVSKVCGIYEKANELNIPLKDFSKSERVFIKENSFAKEFQMAKPAIECDSIINLPKMKTHQLARITGATKNLLGCVSGFNKGLSHVKYPNSTDFSKMLVDLMLTLKPKLHILDGVVAMEGNGPGSGTPKKMNVIIISDDPVAVDYCFAKIVDLNPDYVNVIKYAKEIGIFSEDELEILGDNIDEFIDKDFDVERQKDKKEKWTSVKVFKPFVMKKPYIRQKKCIKCKKCIEACPVPGKAIRFVKNRISYNYNKCIRCYCCQEMCPMGAIDVKTPIISKLLSK